MKPNISYSMYTSVSNKMLMASYIKGLRMFALSYM